MKNYLISLALLITVLAAKAQIGNVIIFSENGESFTVILNGVQQNSQPTTNVKLTGLNAAWFKMKIAFYDASIGTKDFNLGVSLGNEKTFALHKKNNGEYDLRILGEIPLAQAPPTQNGQTEVMFQTVGGPGNNTTTINQQTTTYSNNGNPQNGSVTIGMNTNGAGVGISVSGVDMGTSNSTTTTTTTSSSSSSGSMDMPQHYDMPGYNGPIGCAYPMNREDFKSAKGSISSKDFEDSKMTVAKQIVGNNCLTCNQVKEIMMLFSFENTKLDFAKYAYSYTFDLGNYYKLNDAFSFNSSIDELNKYIEARKR